VSGSLDVPASLLKLDVPAKTFSIEGRLELPPPPPAFAFEADAGGESGVSDGALEPVWIARHIASNPNDTSGRAFEFMCSDTGALPCSEYNERQLLMKARGVPASGAGVDTETSGVDGGAAAGQASNEP